MKATITRSYTTEVEIPDGEYCQRADGSISCKYYYYEIDPIFGSGFFCHEFGHTFNVPYDNLPICAKRDIKKCDACIEFCRQHEGE